ncbi:unnamed protein product, partial [Mesorhabditis belari]|uniref:Uncharacterized protein n=1 Tax=Mesorhabditis belari TaxID=2138241 RepID=A0AAF3EXB9_9BILA
MTKASDGDGLVFKYFEPWVLGVLAALLVILVVVAFIAGCIDFRTRRIKYNKLPEAAYHSPHTLRVQTSASESEVDNQAEAERRRMAKRDRFRKAVCEAYEESGRPLPKSVQDKPMRTAHQPEERTISPPNENERAILDGRVAEEHKESESSNRESSSMMSRLFSTLKKKRDSGSLSERDTAAKTPNLIDLSDEKKE